MCVSTAQLNLFLFILTHTATCELRESEPSSRFRKKGFILKEISKTEVDLNRESSKHKLLEQLLRNSNKKLN